jgi:uncharacterized protein (TIGR02217 family)
MKKIENNFIESRFPEDISFGSSGGPLYSTDVITMVSGHEQRNINWSEARMRFNVAPAIKTEAQLNDLLAFFRNCKGRAIGFRFKDWSDYKAKNQLIAISDGRETKFQLFKTYEAGSTRTKRIITKPAPGKVIVSLNNALHHNFEIDYTTGQINFKTPPAEKVEIIASFEFDVPVRFDTDQLSTSLQAYQLHMCSDIPLIEIK